MEIIGINKKSKEELLDLYFRILSSKGQIVEYSRMKNMSKEELIKAIENSDKNYNRIVYVTDIENNTKICKAILSDDGRVLKFCGLSIVIETLDGFKENLKEKRAEGNEITLAEQCILNEIEKGA